MDSCRRADLTLDPRQMLTEADPPDLGRPAFATHMSALHAARLRAVADAATLAAREIAKMATTKAARHQAKPIIRAAEQARRLADEAERAVAVEDAAERLVPAAQRQAVVDPGLPATEDGPVLLREALWRGGGTERLRRSSMILTLHRRGRMITAAHVRAAGVWERVHEAIGAGALRSCLEERVGGGVPGSGNAAIENGLGTDELAMELRRGVGAFGAGLLDHVVLRNADVASWAAKRVDPLDPEGKPMRSEVATGILAAVLERLAEIVAEPRMSFTLAMLGYLTDDSG